MKLGADFGFEDLETYTLSHPGTAFRVTNREGASWVFSDGERQSVPIYSQVPEGAPTPYLDGDFRVFEIGRWQHHRFLPERKLNEREFLDLVLS